MQKIVVTTDLLHFYYFKILQILFAFSKKLMKKCCADLATLYFWYACDWCVAKPEWLQAALGSRSDGGGNRPIFPTRWSVYGLSCSASQFVRHQVAWYWSWYKILYVCVSQSLQRPGLTKKKLKCERLQLGAKDILKSFQINMIET
jgi:hypothetical protein